MPSILVDANDREVQVGDCLKHRTLRVSDIGINEVTHAPRPNTEGVASYVTFHYKLPEGQQTFSKIVRLDEMGQLPAKLNNWDIVSCRGCVQRLSCILNAHPKALSSEEIPA